MVSGFLFIFYFFGLFRPQPQHMEVPRQGSNQSSSHWPMSQQCQIRATSATYTAVLLQWQILNPLSEARDWTCVLMDANQIHFHWATMETPSFWFLTPSWDYIVPYDKFKRKIVCPCCQGQHRVLLKGSCEKVSFPTICLSLPTLYIIIVTC